MVRILSDDDVRGLLDVGDVLDVVDEAIVKQGAGDVERPERPHFPVGIGLDETRPDAPLGSGLVMPAYIHGADYVGTKLVSVHEENADSDLPTTNAQIALSNAETGQPVAYMDGTSVTGARTGSIGGLAVRELTDGPVRVAVIGAGAQARWQVRAIDAATTIDTIAFYSPTETSRTQAAAQMRDELGIEAFSTNSPETVVAEADVVVTATTSNEPVFSGDALTEGTVVIGVGSYTAEMQEIDATTFDRAAGVFADVPEEVYEIGDLQESTLWKNDLTAFADLLTGDVERGEASDIVVVESVGSAVMDAATGSYVYERAVSEDVGTDVAF
jgi:alanine dehydrogenase